MSAPPPDPSTTAAVEPGRPSGSSSGICWVDLGTTDVGTTAAFYSSLFGWDIGPADPTGYRLAALDGHPVAAFGPAEEPGPPYWTVYAATADVTATAAATTAAGGTVLVPPTPAGDAGVSAVLRGPAGMPLSLWQAGAHLGSWRSQRHGTFAGARLRTDRPAEDAAFLHALLGWDLHGDHFTHAGQPVASWARPTRPTENPTEHPTENPTENPTEHPTASPWLVHFFVDQVQDAVRAAVKLGARALDDAAAAPATLVDPAGALLALIPRCP